MTSNRVNAATLRATHGSELRVTTCCDLRNDDVLTNLAGVVEAIRKRSAV